MESLIGKKAKGFKFSGGKPNYNPLMDECENLIGEIRYTNSDVIQIKFPNGSIWNYPYEKALDHLVEEELEEEQSIEQILNNIKNLTKQI